MNSKLKKFSILILVLSFLLCLASCSSNKEIVSNNIPSSTTSAISDSTISAIEETQTTKNDTQTTPDKEKTDLNTSSQNDDNIKNDPPVEKTEDGKIEETASSDGYIYVILNLSKLTSTDLDSIKQYLRSFEEEAVILDVSSAKLNSAIDILKVLQSDFSSRTGTLKGIQIFGDLESVASYNAGQIFLGPNGITDNGSFYTDVFYQNLTNDFSFIENGFTPYLYFTVQNNFSIIPQVPLARLPLKKGEYENYFNRLSEYNNTNSNSFCIFNNPMDPKEDMSVFMASLKEKYRIFDGDYVVYGDGNQSIGSFSDNSFHKSNQEKSYEYIIISHGYYDEILYTAYDKTPSENSSVININNINAVFDSNPYFLDLFDCRVGELLGSNIISKAMNGQCLGAFGASCALYTSGMDVNASEKELKDSNFFYFYYTYLKEKCDNKNRTTAFFNAQKAYASSIIEMSKKPLDYYKNYQTNLNNFLSYQNFGVLK